MSRNPYMGTADISDRCVQMRERSNLHRYRKIPHNELNAKRREDPKKCDQTLCEEMESDFSCREIERSPLSRTASAKRPCHGGIPARTGRSIQSCTSPTDAFTVHNKFNRRRTDWTFPTPEGPLNCKVEGALTWVLHLLTGLGESGSIGTETFSIAVPLLSDPLRGWKPNPPQLSRPCGS